MDLDISGVTAILPCEQSNEIQSINRQKKKKQVLNEQDNRDLTVFLFRNILHNSSCHIAKIPETGHG